VLICNNGQLNTEFVTSSLIGNSTTTVQLAVNLGVMGYDKASGLSLGVPSSVGDLDVSVLTNASARKCYSELIKISGNSALNKHRISVEGEIYALLSDKNPDKASDQDVLVAFQAAGTITKKKFIDTYDKPEPTFQSIQSYVGVMKALVDPNYETPQLKIDRAVGEAARASKETSEKEKQELKNSYEAQVENIRSEKAMYVATTIGTGVIAAALLGALIVSRKRSNRPQRQVVIERVVQRETKKKEDPDPGIPRREDPKPAQAKTEPRAVSDTTKAPQSQGVGTATVAVPPVDGDMADLAAALGAVGGAKALAGSATAAVASSSLDITADNVIVRDASAPMPAELSIKVLMAQIAAVVPKFLTADGMAIHSTYRAGVERLANLYIVHTQNRPADAKPIASYWEANKSRIRGGGPVVLLQEFVFNQLEKWYEANDSTMSFDPTTLEAMDKEAQKRAGEISAYEKWIQDAMRDPVRLAGR
jgi:hypothetical protein